MDLNTGIAPDKREALAAELSKLLADSYTLYLKTHNFHWNVKGPMFQTLHLMFEEHYNELALAVDLIAEVVGHADPEGDGEERGRHVVGDEGGEAHAGGAGGVADVDAATLHVGGIGHHQRSLDQAWRGALDGDAADGNAGQEAAGEATDAPPHDVDPGQTVLEVLGRAVLQPVDVSVAPRIDLDVEHDRDRLLARRSKGTLKLMDTEQELKVSVTVPETIIMSACRGEPRKTSAPKRAMS